MAIEELKKNILDVIYGADWEIRASCRQYEITEHGMNDEGKVVTQIIKEVLNSFLIWLKQPGRVDSWDQTFFETWMENYLEELKSLEVI